MKKFLILLALGTMLVNAEVLKIGTSISEFDKYKFETPQEEIISILNDTQIIIIAFEKDTGKLANEFLKAKDISYLPNKNAVYIADIHNMPSIITSLFALPKLKKYKHLIYLHYDDEFEDFIVSAEEKITIIRFEDKKVKSISFASNKEELEKEMQK